MADDYSSNLPSPYSDNPATGVAPNLLSQQQLMALYAQQFQPRPSPKPSDISPNWAGALGASIDQFVENRRLDWMQKNFLPRLMGGMGASNLPDLSKSDEHASSTDAKPQADATTWPGMSIIDKTARYENSSLYDQLVKGDNRATVTPYQDGKQTSIGFGTKARPGDQNGITPTAAWSRLTQEIGQASEQVDKFAPGMPVGWHSALTDLTFNAGPGWMNAGLGKAVKAGNWAEAANIFSQYTKADMGNGLQAQPGLLKRRQDFLSAALSPGGGSDVGAPPGGASPGALAFTRTPGSAPSPAAPAAPAAPAPMPGSPSARVADAFGPQALRGAPAPAAPAASPPAPQGLPAAPGFSPQPPAPTAASSATQPAIPPVPQAQQRYQQLIAERDRWMRFPQGTPEHARGLDYDKQANDMLNQQEITLPTGERVVGNQVRGFFPSNLPREPTEAEKRATGTQAEMDTKYWGGIQQGIRSGGLVAAKQEPQIDALEAMSKDPHFIATGTLTGKFEKLGISLGINPGQANAGVNQLANTLLTENMRALQATNMSVGLGGGGGEVHVGTEQTERLATALSSDNTPAGLQMKITLLKRMAAANGGLADIEEAYSGRHGGRLDAGFYGQMRTFSKSQKLFDPKDLLSGEEPPGPTSSAAPAFPTSHAESLINALSATPVRNLGSNLSMDQLNEAIFGTQAQDAARTEQIQGIGRQIAPYLLGGVAGGSAGAALAGGAPAFGPIARGAATLAGKGIKGAASNAWHWAPYLIHELMKGP